MFIQKYTIREVSDLNKTQMELINDNYERMAHELQDETGKMRIAALRDVMSGLLPQLESKKFPSSSQHTPTKSAMPAPLMFVVPLPLDTPPRENR